MLFNAVLVELELKINNVSRQDKLDIVASKACVSFNRKHSELGAVSYDGKAISFTGHEHTFNFALGYISGFLECTNELDCRIPL